MDMKLNYKRRGIFYGILFTISILNVFTVPNMLKLSKIDWFLLIIFPLYFLLVFFVNKSVYKDYVLSEKINGYLFEKNKIDKLHFENPSQMADYFYKEFGTTPTPEFIVRMTIFAYNYFKIEELAKDDWNCKYISKLFKKTFTNSRKVMELANDFSVQDIKEYVTSDSTLRGLIYNLFKDSRLGKDDVWDIF